MKPGVHKEPNLEGEKSMKSKHLLPLSSLLVLGMLISGCNFPLGVSPTEVAVINPETETTTATPTVEPSVPTTETPPTSTPTPTATEVPPSPTPGEEGCIDKAAFVADVTIPDDTPISGGASFTKTWRLQNAGTCTWTSSYALVYSHGDQMSGPAALPLAGAVAPGSTVDLSVNLIAPAAPGTYQGFWKLRNNSGVLFGVGGGGNVAFWVKIVVQPTPTPTLEILALEPIFIPLIFNADFDISFENVHDCGGADYATFKVKNTGTVNLEAARQHIVDLDTSGNLYGPAYSSSPFIAGPFACPAGADTLSVGDTRYIAASVGLAAPSGHHGKATVEMCSKNDMTGFCEEKVVTFIFP
jgi:hypothetical protein